MAGGTANTRGPACLCGVARGDATPFPRNVSVTGGPALGSVRADHVAGDEGPFRRASRRCCGVVLLWRMILGFATILLLIAMEPQITQVLSATS